MRYDAREVVGVFATPDALDNAVEQLGLAGVGRAAISVLAVNAEKLAWMEPSRLARSALDDPAVRQAVPVPQDMQAEGEVVAIAVPVQIGGFAGAWAVAAGGGALVAAIGATLLGGAIGAGLEVLLFRAVSHHHASDVQAQLAEGGLALWVSTPDDAAVQRALEVLRRCGGSSVHVHTVSRAWGVEDTPLHDAQPDPFLQHEPASAGH